MTTLMDPRADAGLPEERARPDGGGSRLSRWHASWRVSLRMARRDLRRHKGRALLVFLMVAIPVALLAGAATLGATQQTDSADRLAAQMGTGQALVQGPIEGKVQQAPDPDKGSMSWGPDNPPTPIPGFTADATVADRSVAVGRLVGGTAVAVAQTEMRFLTGERRVRVNGLVVDPRTVELGAKAHLTGGRWGANATEVVVTPAGVAKGLPTSGAATLSAGGTETAVTVVGTARALSEEGGQPDFVAPAMPGSPGSTAGLGVSWVIVADQPVTWPDVQRLNTYGLTVWSRAVLADPPPDSVLPPELRQQQSIIDDTSRMIAVIGGVMLFIVTTLLVGPAFAVSASRQRRTLALAATNGAETRQLRRTVLAQALVLGVISAIGGVLLGISGVRVGLWWWVRTHPSTSYASVPLDIPWVAMAILLPCAVLSAVVAALLPAMRLGRLDVIGVMRGQSVSPRLNRVVPVVGLVVATIGGLVVVSSARAMVGGEVRIALGAIALVLGTLCAIPALLVLAGRVASVLPVAARMATRDAARHRSRATPTVAAVLAGVAAFTAFSIGLASDTKQRMQEYVPQALPGEGTVYTGDAETRLSVEAALKTVGGGLRTTPMLVVRGADDPLGPQPGTSSPAQPFVAAVPAGCRVEQSILQSGADARCVQLGTMAFENGFIGVLPAAEIASRLHLTDTQRQTVERGGIAVAVPALASETTVTLASGTFVMDQSTYTATDIRTGRSDRLPVVAVPAASRGNGAMPQQTGAFVTPQTVERLGWPATQMLVLLRDADGGAIDRASEKRLDELVGDEGGLHVERGFQRDDEVVMRIMTAAAALLLLAVTLISTALAMAEQQTDQGTFAAVGATRRTRRALAAAQAMVVGFLGALLGVAVGLVPGIAVTYPLTRDMSGGSSAGPQHPIGPFLEIPWQPLLLVVVGVPLLAGLLAAAAVRRAPAVTRRAE